MCDLHKRCVTQAGGDPRREFIVPALNYLVRSDECHAILTNQIVSTNDHVGALGCGKDLITLGIRVGTFGRFSGTLRTTL